MTCFPYNQTATTENIFLNIYGNLIHLRTVALGKGAPVFTHAQTSRGIKLGERYLPCFIAAPAAAT